MAFLEVHRWEITWSRSHYRNFDFSLAGFPVAVIWFYDRHAIQTTWHLLRTRSAKRFIAAGFGPGLGRSFVVGRVRDVQHVPRGSFNYFCSQYHPPGLGRS